MREIYIDDVRSTDGMGLLLKRVHRDGPLRIAIAGSEGSKDILMKFITDRLDFFRDQALVATSGTATLLRNHVHVNVESVGHGPDGGDVILAYKILTREIDVLIFVRAGNELDAHSDDVRMLLRIANMTNCIVATNVATAALVVQALAAVPQPVVASP